MKFLAAIRGKQIWLLAGVLAALSVASLKLERWRILDRQSGLLDQHLVEVNKQLDRLLFFPKVLASDPRFIAVLQEDSTLATSRANQLLEEATLNSGAAFIFIMDPSGDTVASGNWRAVDSFVGRNYNFRPYFREAIQGRQATYYAVGATTGQPGFFIANPIRHEGEILGVIVVKIHLESLQDSWGRLQYDIALFDELNVAILSNRSEFLYAPMGAIDKNIMERIRQEKRYTLKTDALFENRSENSVRFRNSESRADFLTVSRPAGPEPWRVMLFYPETRYWQTASLYVLFLGGIALLIYLLLRLFRQQQFIAEVERSHAQELEARVQERTLQLHSAQQKLIIQSNYAMLGRMSAAINHEINQPLTSLRFNLASLRQLLEQQPLQLEMANQIATESDLTTKRISRVMETLRSVSRTASTDFDTVNLDDLITDTMATVRRERPNMSRCLQTAVLSDGLQVRGNFVLLQQAILNLLANGFDAVMHREDPGMTLELEAGDGVALISVSDNGEGVSSNMTTRLFEEFATGKSGKKGLGLGLALSNQIAMDHGGRLAYAPLQSGGSRFSMEIPMYREADFE